MQKVVNAIRANKEENSSWYYAKKAIRDAKKRMPYFRVNVSSASDEEIKRRQKIVHD